MIRSTVRIRPLAPSFSRGDGASALCLHIAHEQWAVVHGCTSNLKRRVDEHQRGGVASTRHRRPVDLIHAEAYVLKSDAERRERYLKSTEGKRMLQRQIEGNPAKSAYRL